MRLKAPALSSGRLSAALHGGLSIIVRWSNSLPWTAQALDKLIWKAIKSGRRSVAM